MSNPPKSIQIKRKRDEDSITFLYLNKRQRSNGAQWVYQRKDVINPPVPAPAVPSGPSGSSVKHLRPIIRSSSPEDATENTPPPSTTTSPVPPNPGSSPKNFDSAPRPRRFQIFRTDTEARSDGISSSGASRKRRYSTLVLVEQPGNISRKPPGEGLGDDGNVEKVGSPSASRKDEESTARPLKKPNLRKHSTSTPKSIPPRAPLPDISQAHGESLEKLAAELNAWTIDQISQNLEEAKSIERRYRPRPPAKRNVELQLERPDDNTNSNDHYASEEEYVNDEFVLVGDSHIGDNINPHDIGELVLEHDSDLDIYCGTNDDDEDCYDPEDENAENHPDNDYPEDPDSEDSEDDGWGYRHGHRWDVDDGLDEDGIAAGDDDSDGY